MNTHPPAYPAFTPIGKHGAIGDRRTGALVAACGSVSWFCAPEFDGAPIFGALLDPERGGFCRFGPREVRVGQQHYLPGTAALVTTWTDAAGAAALELTDVMAWPADARPKRVEDERVIIRRMRALKDATLRFELWPRRNFAGIPENVRTNAHCAVFTFADGQLGLWSSFETSTEPHGAFAVRDVRAQEEHWAVIGWKTPPEEWSIARAAGTFAEAVQYWTEWSADLELGEVGEHAPALRRSAITVHLLSHAKHDSAVAALTNSLPERIGGDRNYDYRYAWVRDASLSLALLARMGKVLEVQRYLTWLCGLRSTTEAPLQVCYRLDGNPHLAEQELDDVRGYRDSRPVHVGNRAARQLQLGSLGFFADCARIYLDQGGEWTRDFWLLLKRVADFACAHWQEKDSGIWELPQEEDYVASRVMSWVVLHRAVYIASQTGHAAETGQWGETAAAIHAEVMAKGWCEEKNAFRQRYGSDALDAAALLIPLMEFLPVDHPRVAGTLAALERELVVDGLMHRFNPREKPGAADQPVGRFEGAFLPCVFWHAHTLAKAGRCDEAEAILRRCEAIADGPGLFAEEVDGQSNTFLGNTPLLFSHVEYVRAVTELSAARRRAHSSRQQAGENPA